MGKLGISLYPEKSSLAAEKVYLQQAKDAGFSRIFMNLLVFKEKNLEPILRRVRETVLAGNQLGFETIIDVNPYTFKALKGTPANLAPFSELGVAGIRLDMGFSGKEEAEMTRNPYGLKIEINMSNKDTYLQRIFDYHPNREQLIGCHNFFPQAYTGLSSQQFQACSQVFRERGLRTAAFVTSQVGEIGPWPLHEGLCTLEDHRKLSLEAQVRHLKLLDSVEDLIIGNAFASPEELHAMSRAAQEAPCLTVKTEPGMTALEREILEKTEHTFRGDCSEYMIRSSYPRLTYRDSEILPRATERLVYQPGDVVIANQDYAQYKAEVQIILKERPADSRLNYIGKIGTGDFLAVEALQPYAHFFLRLV